MPHPILNTDNHKLFVTLHLIMHGTKGGFDKKNRPSIEYQGSLYWIDLEIIDELETRKMVDLSSGVNAITVTKSGEYWYNRWSKKFQIKTASELMREKRQEEINFEKETPREITEEQE